MMKKFVTFEQTLSKKDIESILRQHFANLLEEQDVDFRASRWVQDDFTYSFKDGQPSIDVIIILDDAKLRKK